MEQKKRRIGKDRTGCQNKSTAVIKDLVQSNVDFPKLIKQLSIRAMKGSDPAAKLLFEYGFGKAPQPMEHTGGIGVKIIRDNI
ncbi:MAG: hypothetical protein IMZ53_05400 [Thermoplasmata archaeon]|nr:hypothetical protein [Thermoplasmata archaeon]